MTVEQVAFIRSFRMTDFRHHSVPLNSPHCVRDITAVSLNTQQETWQIHRQADYILRIKCVKIFKKVPEKLLLYQLVLLTWLTQWSLQDLKDILDK